MFQLVYSDIHQKQLLVKRIYQVCQALAERDVTQWCLLSQLYWTYNDYHRNRGGGVWNAQFVVVNLVHITRVYTREF